jgi:hypothetical protein
MAPVFFDNDVLLLLDFDETTVVSRHSFASRSSFVCHGGNHHK